MKRGTVTEDVAVAWNEAKTEATLTKSGNFTPAEYTVTVSGIEGIQNASNAVKIEAEKVESIEIANAQLQKSATAPLTVNFLNQYGEKATVAANNVTITAFNTTDSTRTVSRVAGQYQLNSSTVNVGDKVQVTVIFNGLTATKTLDVVSAATVGEVTLGNVVLPTGKDKLTLDGTKNVELTYTAKNTLGEDHKLTSADITGATAPVQFHSSNSQVLNVSDITVDADNKIKIAKFGKAGEVTLTAISTATGKSSTVTITVQENEGAPYSVALEKDSAEFAAGSITSFYVGMTVSDKYGTAIATKDLKSTDYEISVDNSSVVASASFETTPGTDYGKIKVIPASTTKGNSAVVTVLVKATGQKSTFTVTASEAALPTSIDTEKDTTVSTNLLVGATQTIKLDTKDQYGTVVGATQGYTVDYTTSDASVLSITSPESGDALGSEEVTVKALKAGTVVLKAQLKKDGVAMAEKAYTITVVANDSTKVTYGIPTIAPVYKTGVTGVKSITNTSSSDDKKAAVESGYAEEVALQATDANGNVSLVPTSAVVGDPVITQATKADGSAKTTGQLEWFEYNGKYYVVTKTDFVVGDFSKTSGSEDVKAKITFTVNAEDTVKLVSQDITISKDDLAAQSVEFKTEKPGTSNAADVTELTLSDLSKYGTTGKIAYIWTKDQFGGYDLSDDTLGTKVSLVAVSGADVTKIAKDKVTFDESNGTVAITDTDTDKNTTFTANDAKFRIIATSGDKTNFITVTVTDGVTPKADATTPIVANAVSDSYKKDDTLTIKFSEAVKVSEITTIGNLVLDKSHTWGDDATVDAVDAVDGYATTFTIKLGTNTTVAAADTITITSTGVVDKADNAAASDVTFTVPTLS